MPVYVVKKPAWVEGHHTSPCLLVAPREDLTEDLDEMHLAGQAVFSFDVFVGLVWPAEWDEATLQRRAAIRAAVRGALWPRFPPGVAFDVDYVPNPAVAGPWLTQPARDNLDIVWQLFKAKVELPA